MKISKIIRNNSTHRLIAALLFLINFNVLGDGSAQLEQQGRPVKVFINGGGSKFAGYRADADPKEKINFYITDPANESVYLGFGATYKGNSSTESPAYFRIRNAAGIVKFGPQLITPSITNLSQVQAGPFGGYSPIIFNPTDTGVYSLEINEKAGNDISTQALALNFLDITVANPATKVVKPGRVWSMSWVLTTLNGVSEAYSKFIVSPSQGTLYEIDLNGLKSPILNVFTNTTGVGTTGNTMLSVKQFPGYNASLKDNRYKLYLTQPDYLPGIFQNIAFSGKVRLTGCSNLPFKFNFSSPSACSAEVFLDINGVQGYQDNTTDRKWVVFLKAGANAIDWDGKDGFNKDLPAGGNITVHLKPIYGYANLPLFNVLSNPNGIIIRNIKAGTPSHKVYWNDSLVYQPYSSFNKGVVTRNLDGCASSACHSWTDLALDVSGNTAPVGKDAVINTWWYATGQGVETVLVVEKLCTPIVVDDNFEIPQNGTLTNKTLFTNDFYNDPSTILSDLNGMSQNGGIYSLDSSGLVYKPKLNFSGIDQLTYVVCNKQKPTLCDTGLVTINVIPGLIIKPVVNLLPIDIPSGFTPNDDNVNDYFHIKNIELYTDNVVRIYSRWGDMVYEGKGYDNESVKWSGTSSRTGIPGQLPEGTYYYVIDKGDGSEVAKSFVILFR